MAPLEHGAHLLSYRVPQSNRRRHELGLELRHIPARHTFDYRLVGISNGGHANASCDGSASAQSSPPRRLRLTVMNSASLTALRDAFQHCREMNASLKERLDR